MGIWGSRITRCGDYVHVDFGASDCLGLCETYRQFADLCIGWPVDRALLKAGDNDPHGHRGLRDALMRMAHAAAISPGFKLALVPGTPAVHIVYREAQEALRAMGVNAWVFKAEREARDWLEGRTPFSLTAS